MRRRPVGVLVVLLSLATAAWALARADERRFPHARHAGLFPTCVGCHAGVLSGSEAELYPAPQQCQGCHDGRQEQRVDWAGPAREPSNLRFSHVEHNREAPEMGDPALNCRQCHARMDPGVAVRATRRDTASRVVRDTVPREIWMAVGEAQPRQCISCHGHPATAHLADDAPCRTCHVTVVQARALPESTVARFPLPPSHERPDWATNHGPTAEQAQARCAVCHARQSCERCHVNARTVPAIAALEPDERVARVVAAKGASYPVPASHLRPDFHMSHGRDARERIQSCANCHAQPSCRSCHIGSGAARVIARLPNAAPGGAQGVRLRGRDPTFPPAPASTGATERPLRAPEGTTDGGAAAGRAVLRTSATRLAGAGLVRPASSGTGIQPADTIPPDTARRVRGAQMVRVHQPGFATTHGPEAASGQLDCSGCHARKFCADCHQGEGRRRYHVPDFVARHASDAYGRQQECAQCHNTETFCRACHQGSGLSALGRNDIAFHNGQPLWLLQHGQAARQGLESCASCHRQGDCMQCHSTQGRGISPHGLGFDAARMGKRNPGMCQACHLGDPLARRR